VNYPGYTGTGRFDQPAKHLRALAVLHREAVWVLARPDVVSNIQNLRGKKVVCGSAANGVALPQLQRTTVPTDAGAVEEFKRGRFDAWLGVAPPGDPTLTALMAAGAKPIGPGPSLAPRIDDDVWPLQPSTVPGALAEVPVVLIATDTVPRAQAEDLVDALFGDLARVHAADPAARTISRESAALPTPVPLHPGAALAYERGGPLDKPVEVIVRTWVYDLGAIDLHAGTFRIDCTVELNWLDTRLQPDDVRPFEVMNAVEVSIEEPYGYQPRGRYHALTYRLHGTLRGDFDLRRYPFDRQSLRLDIEHPMRASHRLVFKPEVQVARDIDLVRDRMTEDFHVHDWTFVGATATTRDVRYGPDERYHRHTLAVQLKRDLLPFVFRDLAPVVLMVLLALAAGLIPSGKLDGKLLLTVLALLVAVELQVARAETAPDLGYLTLGEWMCLLAYASIAGGVLQTIVEYRLHAHGRDDTASRVHKGGMVLAALVFVLPSDGLVIARL
jgi:hypothetical protein